jgi:hypothetical protein
VRAYETTVFFGTQEKPQKNWSAAFTDLPPIALPDGRKLKTLADCRAYILARPRATRRAGKAPWRSY